MRDILAVDIGGTNIRVAILSYVEGSWNLIRRHKVPTTSSPIDTLKSEIKNILSSYDTKITKAGISVAGIVDSKKGVLMRSPNISKMEHIDFKGLMLNDFSLQAVIENDANAATYGEKVSGAGREFDNFVMLTLGTGIGGGVVKDGKLLSIAAEIGHMSINHEGAHCPCGNIGCLETTASATAVINKAITEIERGNDSILKSLYNGNFYKMNAEDVYKAALEGDLLARNVLKDAGKNLGIGIANLVNIFSPDAVILTGGLIGAWNIYVESAKKEAIRRGLKELMMKVKIIPSALGDDAGLIGIAQIALEAF
ncbi:MAG: ROK family protein [Thermodesulfovibrionales bacterium]|nr:ROK family protein [Thermodesulfovibrionales bacterium]